MAQPDIRALELGMLRAFDALMRERSVSRAAARLFLSQPAVSASLRRLRTIFDDPLFTRTAHGVAPTPRAAALAPLVEQVLADIGALLADAKDFDPAESDRVFRVAGSDHMSGLVLPPLCATLNACGSGIRIVWEPPGGGALEEKLHRGDLDVAVIARIHPPRDLRTVALYEDHYVYVMRAGHPRAAEPVTLELFCEIPQTFLGYGSSTLDDRIDEVLGRARKRRSAQVAVSSLAQVFAQIEQAGHAAVLGSRVAQTRAAQLRIAPLPFELPPYQLLLCRGARSDTDSGVRWLCAQIMAVFGKAAA